jgi:hypothetical protein
MALHARAAGYGQLLLARAGRQRGGAIIPPRPSMRRTTGQDPVRRRLISALNRLVEGAAGSPGSMNVVVDQVASAHPAQHSRPYWQRYIMPSAPLIAVPGVQLMPLRAA